MSYYDTYSKYKDLDIYRFFSSLADRDIGKAIDSENPNTRDLLALLSPLAARYLEEMANRAHYLTLNQFGRAIQLYTPMYLANYCENECAYCGFNAKNKIERRTLKPAEVEEEARFISSTGLRHILLLTGESRKESPVDYIKECVRIVKKYFGSISIEVYPLTEAEYADLVRDGVDGLTIYQETYDETLYEKVHPAGPKRDYKFRLDAPERGAVSGIRNVNIGALLGLNDWRREIFYTALHAKYLQDKFPDVEMGSSIPRLRPHRGDFKALSTVSDKDIVQIVLALRIFLPRLGISVSTREAPKFRDNLVSLGITRMSAGSTTRVGGHTINADEEDGSSQFEISDRRSVAEIKAMLEAKGYQGVLKDWLHL